MLGYIDIAVNAGRIIAVFSGMDVTAVDNGDGRKRRGIRSRRKEILPHGHGPVDIVLLIPLMDKNGVALVCDKISTSLFKVFAQIKGRIFIKEILRL